MIKNGYILTHLSDKFGWDENEKEDFYKMCQRAFFPEKNPINKKLQQVAQEIQIPEIKEDKEEELKNDNDKIMSTLNPNEQLDDHGITMRSEKNGIQEKLFAELTETESASTYGDPIGKRWPRYISKALFYRSDDEMIEVLIDQAILFLLSDQFTDLWESPNFVSNLYDDKTYFKSVKQIQEIINGIAVDNKKDFFHQFVEIEYEDMIGQWKSDVMQQAAKAKTDHREHSREVSVSMSGLETFRGINDQLKNQGLNNEYFKDTDDIQKENYKFSFKKDIISNSNVHNLDVISTYWMGNAQQPKQQKNQIIFTIEEMKSHQTDEQLPKDEFLLSNRHPKKGFKWAIWKTKSINRYSKRRLKSGYWRIYDSDETNSTVEYLNCILGLLRFFVTLNNKPQDKYNDPKRLLHTHLVFKKKISTAQYATDNPEVKRTKTKEYELIKNKSVLKVKIKLNNEEKLYEIEWWNHGDAYNKTMALVLSFMGEDKKGKKKKKKNICSMF